MTATGQSKELKREKSQIRLTSANVLNQVSPIVETRLLLLMLHRKDIEENVSLSAENKSCLIGRLAEINKCESSNVRIGRQKIKHLHLGYRLHGLIFGASVPPSPSSSSSSASCKIQHTRQDNKCASEGRRRIPLG